MPEFEKIYLPDSVKPFTDMDPIGTKELLIDDNRSAVSREPYMTIDGTDFYFSVKGIGSTTSPFSRQLFKKEEICSLLKNNGIRDQDHECQGEGDEVSKVSYWGVVVKGMSVWIAGA